MEARIENFLRAFSDGQGSVRGHCACGRQYHDGTYKGWEFGELAKLIHDKSTEVDGTVSFLSFNGKTYVDWCPCWEKDCLPVAKWIESYRYKITAYLNAERARQIKEATALPVVETGK